LPSDGGQSELDVSLQQDRFFQAMDDDLNTPLAIKQVQEITSAILQAPEEDDLEQAQETLRTLSGILGLTLTEA
jgi:cysteinyl-tRNA synthetase